jgi:hypothetical protein
VWQSANLPRPYKEGPLQIFTFTLPPSQAIHNRADRSGSRNSKDNRGYKQFSTTDENTGKKNLLIHVITTENIL